MINIVGNIKINDATRLKYLKATLWSFEFIKDCQLLLNVDCDRDIYNEIDTTIKQVGFSNYHLLNGVGNYGVIYCSLLDKANSEFVLNLIEDCFCLLDNKDKLAVILKAMKTERVDLCKASFWQIEKNSNKEILGHHDMSYGLVYDNTLSNHNKYQKFYGSRYYIGVNFITTLEFAKKFWSRKINTNRPHEYEIAKYKMEFEHRCLIPNVEIMCAIEDNHGEAGTCLLERKEEKKFWNIYNKL